MSLFLFNTLADGTKMFHRGCFTATISPRVIYVFFFNFIKNNKKY